MKDSDESVFVFIIGRSKMILGKDLLENSETLLASINMIKVFNLVDNASILFGNHDDANTDKVKLLVDIFEDVV